MLAASHLTLRIGRRRILDDVDFEARAGAVTAIVGPNGSGKTTLLRALTGEGAAEGRITLNGIDIAAARPARLAAVRAVLPQATPLAFPFLVAEVVRLGQRAGLSAADPGLAERALSAVGLQGLAARPYQELSGGEQQRVQLARVLAQVWQPVGPEGPHWLFLDEPVASLDIAHQLQVMRLARGYADAGGGVVAVMHDLNLTAMFADRVALLAGGRVLAAGRVSEVLTDTHLSQAYGCALRVGVLPAQGPYILPQAAGAA
ncbi:heme ABC transporter ATP-binding protein [Rhodobacter calidifons]|uniref:Heme ABC transporter ATP-binding protein n=1 Tax=Rhodobacter calidifons TaxID=2715277 RepID=A0ABX0G9B2_9RHOB|nr:heme ABC transporter ATP-binding protein [Rhodobacter calidifons]NHB77504.1 heme ABC transporter ATP-binding protein [Rhodobacter calidifons]